MKNKVNKQYFLLTIFFVFFGVKIGKKQLMRTSLNKTYKKTTYKGE